MIDRLPVHIRINDAATGQPTPVRISLYDANGWYCPPFGRAAPFATGSGVEVGGHLALGGQGFFYIDGTCEAELEPGELTVEVSKGPEYTPLRTVVRIAPGQISLRLAIKRWTNLRAQGWYSGDTQVFCIDPFAALLEGSAEDLAVVNVLAHERGSVERSNYWIPNILAFSGQSAALERPGHLVAVNTLNSHQVLGAVSLLNCHRPIYPLDVGWEDRLDGRWSLADLCDQCHRKKKGLVVWSDTRALRTGYGYPEQRLRSEVLVNLILGKVDAFEVVSFDSTEPAGLAEWYQLLAAGLRVPLVGGSGKDSNDVLMGRVRTYARLGEGEEFSYVNWIEAVRAGRTFVTNGLLLRLSVGGQGPGSVLKVAAEQRVPLRAEAASAVPFERLELLVNGEVVASAAPAADGLSASVDAEWVADRSAWVAARCSGATQLSDGQRVFAQSSPAYVETEGRPFQPAAAVVESLANHLERVADWVRTTRCDNEHHRENVLSMFTSARERLLRGKGSDG
jgi:hypothetical protein